MTPSTRLVRRIAHSAILAAAGLAACGIVGPQVGRVCTLIGCSSGLTVHLATRPQGAYRVEVFANYPGQGPAYVYECTGISTCVQDIFFQDLIVDHPFIRVTTAAGSRTTVITTVTYTDHYPNGKDCGPPCKNATVTAEVL